MSLRRARKPAQRAETAAEDQQPTQPREKVAEAPAEALAEAAEVAKAAAPGVQQAGRPQEATGGGRPQQAEAGGSAVLPLHADVRQNGVHPALSLRPDERPEGAAAMPTRRFRKMQPAVREE